MLIDGPQRDVVRNMRAFRPTSMREITSLAVDISYKPASQVVPANKPITAMSGLHNEDDSGKRFTRKKEMSRRRSDWKHRPDQRTPTGSGHYPRHFGQSGAEPHPHDKGPASGACEGGDLAPARSPQESQDAWERMSSYQCGLGRRGHLSVHCPAAQSETRSSPRKGGAKESKLATSGASSGKLAE